MQPSRSNRRRVTARLLPMLLGLLLVVTACAPTAVAPPSTGTPPAAAPATSAPAAGAATTAPGEKLDVQAGVDAEGNFYRGDPNAAVKLTEYSDFQ